MWARWGDLDLRRARLQRAPRARLQRAPSVEVARLSPRSRPSFVATEGSGTKLGGSREPLGGIGTGDALALGMSIHLSVYGQTDPGLIRSSNEDAFVVADLTGDSLLQEQRVGRFEVRQRGVLLAVSDGVGGHAAGEVASALVVESLRRSMVKDPAEPQDTLLEKAVIKANREVWEAAHYPGRRNMGATLTALFIHGGVAHIAEVGDSRAYLVRNGNILQVTRDQSYVQLLMDAGAISPQEAQGSEIRNVILQAMGLKPDVSVALGRLDLRDRDAFILCSDGLSNKVDMNELRDIVLSSSGKLDAACRDMIELAKERGGDDNITAIVAGVGGDLPKPLATERISQSLHVLREYEPPQSVSVGVSLSNMAGQERAPRSGQPSTRKP
jgi:serine/threonine protein phosphatase PrpC